MEDRYTNGPLFIFYNMKEIYVIYECIGSWDDYRETLICACGTEGKAKQIIEDFELNGPRLPYYDQGPEKFEEFQKHIDNFDEMMEDEGAWDEGGRWFDGRWSVGHKDFIDFIHRTDEQLKEEKEFNERCHKEYAEERLKYMQEMMPGFTKKMMDDWEYLFYYMDNPTYKYKAIPYKV